MLVALLLGAFAVIDAAEEEPQINVTMANVLIRSRASAKDGKAWSPSLRSRCSQIAGIEHVMPVSQPGMAIVTVQYKVGVPARGARASLRQSSTAMPTGCPGPRRAPIIKPKGIDDVPIVTPHAVEPRPRDQRIRPERVAHSIEIDLKRVPGTREVTTVGGPGAPCCRDRSGGSRSTASPWPTCARRCSRRTSARRRRPPHRQSRHADRGRSVPGAMRETCRRSVVAVRDGRPGTCPKSPTVRDGPPPPSRYLWHGIAGERRRIPAVTIAITKKPGENAIDVARATDAAPTRCVTP